MKKILLASLFSLPALSANAQDSFTSEVTASMFKIEEVRVYALSGSYYFDAVSTDSGPLAEAVFLNRVNSVRGNFTRNETKYASGGVSSSAFEINSWSLGGTYHFENSGLFLSADVAHINGDNAAGYGLSGGYYLSDDWTVSVGTSFDEDLEYQGFGIATKKLVDIGDGTFVNLEAAYNKPDEGRSNYLVKADYYFNKRLSLGLSHAWEREFDRGSSALNGQWFINDNLSITAQITDTDVRGDSETGYGLGVKARF